MLAKLRAKGQELPSESGAYSSVVERFLDMEEVRSSILRTPTISFFEINGLSAWQFSF